MGNAKPCPTSVFWALTPEFLTSSTREMTGFEPTAHTRSSENAEILALAVFSVGENFRRLFLHLKDDRIAQKSLLSCIFMRAGQDVWSPQSSATTINVGLLIGGVPRTGGP